MRYPFGHSGDGGTGIGPDGRWDDGAVADVEVLVAENLAEGVGDGAGEAGFGGVADIAAAEEVDGEVAAEGLVPGGHGDGKKGKYPEYMLELPDI